ncbi:MAG: DUF2892 domain-containing protein [Candidatus Mcinerneyibacterium aminivorans]|uniref:DUF2892 domain-containing protein n=1 Tax=Candidatus Mcinerneyibacterium aminivorans TaxID=2703815 RepID=A0A5D0MFC6_9BACT|nr:MAG: DUF2892 domain-containing protein [Candidatus Mcinerneyibacterium aminivorans]
MRKNMGKIDKIIRFILAVVVIILIIFNQITNTAAVILGILAIIFILTSFTGVCPLYIPLKINTKKEDED